MCRLSLRERTLFRGAKGDHLLPLLKGWTGHIGPSYFTAMLATLSPPPPAPRSRTDQQTLVIVGNGMVGLRFCEKLIEADPQRRFKIVTFCEEPRAAYDRVGLTSFFAHRDAEKMMLARKGWYEDHGVELHIGDRANFIDRERKIVKSDQIGRASCRERVSPRV